MTTADSLRALPYFADLPTDLLERVAAGSESVDLDAGVVIIEEGSESDEMYVVVSGELVVTKKGTAEKEVTLARLNPGEVVGEIALLDEAPRTATVTTALPTTLIRIPAASFGVLLSDADVVRRMFRTVTSRLRGIEDTLRHEERMAALGKMAAQLMHELNNPAAAVGRSSGELGRVYGELNDVATTLARSLGDGVDFVRPEPPGDMSPMEAGDREDELAMYAVPVDAEETVELIERWAEEHDPPYELLTGIDSSEVDKINQVILETLRADAVPATFLTDNGGRVLIARWGVPSISAVRKWLWLMEPEGGRRTADGP